MKETYWGEKHSWFLSLFFVCSLKILISFFSRRLFLFVVQGYLRFASTLPTLGLITKRRPSRLESIIQRCFCKLILRKKNILTVVNNLLGRWRSDIHHKTSQSARRKRNLIFQIQQKSSHDSKRFVSIQNFS